MVQHLKDWWKSRRGLEERPVPEEDPIVNSSLALPMAIFSLLLVISLLWAFFEEGWGLRPWRAYQQEFSDLYQKALLQIGPEREQEEQVILASQGYQELLQKVEASEQAIQSDMERLEAEEREVRDRLNSITKPFASLRSQVQAKVYELETGSEGAREGLQEDLDSLQQETQEVTMPDGPREYNFAEMEEEFNRLKARQGEIQTEKVALLRAPSQLRREVQNYVNNRLTGLTNAQTRGLMAKAENMDISIRQIHLADMNVIDRCASCHAGIREPVTLTADLMDGKRVFTSHPQPDLLQIHDPDSFGCSPCHNGNGIGTTSPTRAHGNYKHWLWPLYAQENFQAGCLQCHEADRQLAFAENLNAAKDLYATGCVGCHPREGFDVSRKQLRENEKNFVDLQAALETKVLEIERLNKQGDQASSNEEANRFFGLAEIATLKVAEINADIGRIKKREGGLLMEVKTVGPNLKEVRAKLRKEWIPVWITNPQAFRPNTKMPQFRLDESEVQAISAFIWQSGVQIPAPQQPAGDAAQGQRLFQSRGCLSCHSVGEGDQTTGGVFAANLSRVGEKANYNYLVRWVHDPRQRSLPYCPVHKRDITPEDYASQGVPFEFDLEHTKCPLGDHSLQVQNQILMPSLRLSDQDSRDIAGYLMTLRKSDASYPPAPFIDDAELVNQGRFLVRHYGCAGCHEIAGLEDEGKIGTDLTVEGSKPIERLDFALLTHEAKKEDWYDHKGFFERKLAKPEIFDEGKIKAPLERLRMPNFHMTEGEIDQMTTFLLGSVESKFPDQFDYNPGPLQKDVQTGWEIVKKYNCMGCHEVAPGQATILQGLPQYQGDGKEKLPPSLVGEGARANPEWLARFLKNPALSTTDTHKNGVRPYLEVRMPTFNFSDSEVQTLVRFFQGMAKQPLPYMPSSLEPLTDQELTMVRTLFTHPSAPCLRCHATGEPVHDQTATAPNFLLVRERLKPDWTQRWIVHPEVIRPGTAMPSGLFRWDGTRWVFALATLESFRGYTKDESQLLVRYMFQFTPEEQRRLTGR